MKQRLVMFIAMLFLVVGSALAQTKATGVVISAEDGQPVVGASVRVVGENTGAVTDMDGKYTIKVPSSKSQLEITYVGMISAVITAGNNVKTFLNSDAAGLDEVVVVAYGTQKKTTLTGAIQSVKSEAIELRPTSSVASALEGTVSGVQVNSTYGAPGSDPIIHIRGVGTVNGTTTPLYVLDGVPFGGNVSDLNPSDIESISVLKDAASAALYGNRASNGVVLITTKKGKQGKLNVTLDIKQGTYSRGIAEYDRTNTRQWMETEFQNLMNHRMYTNDEDAATAATYAKQNLINDIVYLNIFNKKDEELFDANGKMVSDAQILNGYADDLDWYDQGVRNGYRQEYNLSANGANEKTDYRFSAGYLDENGYLKDSGFERFTAALAMNTQVNKWLKTGLSLNASHQNYTNTNGNSDASYTNVFMYAREISPVYPVHLHDAETGAYILDANGNKLYDGGSYYFLDDASGKRTYWQDGTVAPDEASGIATRNQYSDRHVYWENELNFDKTTRNTVNAIAYADFILPYGFTFTMKGNLNLRSNKNSTYNSAIIGDGKGSLGRAKRDEDTYKNYTFQQQLHWTHEYGKHSVDAFLSHENYHYAHNNFYGYKTNEIIAGWGNFNNFTSTSSCDEYDTEYATESYLGRVRYGFDDRYNVEASFRRDGSSRFSKDARWGNFWSIGANWVVSNEEFMKQYDFVNYLKLRADYGEVGNDAAAGYYSYKKLYTISQNANNGALYLSQFANPNLKWETNQSWGVGIEARLFNRWNINLEYFDKRNKDLIFDVYMPLSSGATTSSDPESTISRNFGTIANTGVEISTDIDVFKNKDWKINIGANATFLKNKIVTLPEQNKNGIIDGTKYIVEGKSRYEFYMYTFEGINSKNGYSLYKFNDGDAQGKAYRFELDGVKYGNWDQDENGNYIASNIAASTVASDIVVIDGTPYSYTTTYAKKEFHGSAFPSIYGSFNFGITWKNITLNALFTYQTGGKMIDGVYSSLMSVGSTPSNFHKDIVNAWTVNDATAEDGMWNGSVPVVNYDINTQLNATSSRFLTSADYLVFKNLNIAYQLPKSIVRKAGLEGVGVNIACENVFTNTARKGMNPQQSFNGTQYNYLVTPRVFSIGLNVKF